MHGQKHWWYRLKREYEEEAKIKKRLEERKAKKDFKKLMKKQRIDKVLNEEEDYESLYADKEAPKEEDLPAGYADEAEYAFYGGDHDFMRYHKRTKENMRGALEELVQSDRQRIAVTARGM